VLGYSQPSLRDLIAGLVGSHADSSVLGGLDTNGNSPEGTAERMSHGAAVYGKKG
jgi:hypothetical protein